MSKRILCYGDSNTWGYDPDGQPPDGAYPVRYPSEVRWTGVLQKLLGQGYTVIEEGLNGRTTVWDDPVAPYRNGWKHLDACMESHTPIDLLVVMLGTNDLKPRISGNAYDIAQGVDKLVDAAGKNPCGRYGKKPAVMIVSPVHVGADIESAGWLGEEVGGLAARAQSQRLAGYLEQKAQKHGCAFLDAALAAQTGSDAIHMDAAGHAALAAALAEQVTKLLG